MRLSLAVALASGLITFLCWPAATARPAGIAANPQAAPPAATAPELATASLDRPQQHGAPSPDNDIVYPDGSRRPALNGVTHPPRPIYPDWLRCTPVVRVVRGADGRDWYEHEDGTRTTTYWTWRADLGRMDAVTDVAAAREQKPAID